MARAVARVSLADVAPPPPPAAPRPAVASSASRRRARPSVRPSGLTPPGAGRRRRRPLLRARPASRPSPPSIPPSPRHAMGPVSPRPVPPPPVPPFQRHAVAASLGDFFQARWPAQDDGPAAAHVNDERQAAALRDRCEVLQFRLDEAEAACAALRAVEADRRARDAAVDGIPRADEGAARREELRGKAHALTAEEATLPEELTKTQLTSTIEELKQDRKEMEKESEQLRTKLGMLSEELADRQNVAGKLATDCSSAKDERRRQLRSIESEREELKGELGTAQRERDHATNELHQEKQKLASALASRDKAAQEMTRRIEESEKAEKQAEGRADALSNEMIDLRRGFKEEADELRQAADKENHCLTSTIEELKQDRKEMEKKNEQLRTKLSMLSKEQAESRDMMEKLRQQLQSAKSEREELKCKIEKVQDCATAKLHQEKQNLTSALASRDEAAKVLTVEIEKLRKEKQQAQTEVDALSSNFADLKSGFKEEVDNLVQEKRRLTSDLSTKEESIFELKKHNEQMEFEKSELRKKNHSVENERKDLKRKVLMVQREPDWATDELCKNKEPKKEADDKMQGSDNEKCCLKSMLVSSKEQIQELEKEKNDMEKENNQLQNKLNVLSDKLASRQGKAREISKDYINVENKIRKRIQSDESERKELTCKLRALQIELDWTTDMLCKKKRNFASIPGMQIEELKMMKHEAQSKIDALSKNNANLEEVVERFKLDLETRFNKFCTEQEVPTCKQEILDFECLKHVAPEDIFVNNKLSNKEIDRLPDVSGCLSDTISSLGMSDACSASRFEGTSHETETTIKRMKKHHFDTVMKLQDELTNTRKRLKKYKCTTENLAQLLDSIAAEASRKKLKGNKQPQSSISGT